MYQIIILLATVIIGTNPQHTSTPVTTSDATTVQTTTVTPEFEGTTDIPEEIERGEDVVTKNGSLPTTPWAHDPMEQSDTYNPTRQPMPIQHSQITKRHVPVVATRTTPTKTAQTAQQTENPKTTTETEEPEVEETTTGGQENVDGNNSTKTDGSCPALHDAVVEHHVILRHGDCEIVISQDDSIRWFNEPGKSAPSVFVRHINS